MPFLFVQCHFRFEILSDYNKGFPSFYLFILETTNQLAGGAMISDGGANLETQAQTPTLTMSADVDLAQVNKYHP